MARSQAILADGARGSNPRGWSECKGCQARILWCATLEGKPTPFDSEPIVISRNGAGDVEYVSTKNSHWAICPKRDQFKGKR